METIDVTAQTKDMEATVNEGFKEIAGMIPGMGEKVERLGARFESSATVSEDGLQVLFQLRLDNVNAATRIDPMTQIDIMMVQVFAEKFAERHINR